MMRTIDAVAELHQYSASLKAEAEADDGFEDIRVTSAAAKYFDDSILELIAVVASRQRLIDGPDFSCIVETDDEALDMAKTERCIRDHRRLCMTQIQLDRANIETLIDTMKPEWMFWRVSDYNQNIMLGNCLGDILAIT